MAGSDTRERTALIATVLNEADSIDVLLESVASLTHAPDEIVIVDGGSLDGTWQKLQAWRERLPLVALQAPGSTIAAGRNLAIQTASADVIAVTDAGVRLEPDWLASLLACLSRDTDVVGGFFAADARTPFEQAMGATVLPALDDVRPERFLPSSRSVLFRRAAWQAVGGYPEWLDYCEDLVFDLALERAGCRFAFAPHALVWFRPRGSWSSFFGQYYRYARGDGKADLWRVRHAIRYLTYAAALWLVRRGAFLPLVVGAILYTRRPYERLLPRVADLPAREIAYVAMLVPIVRLVGDVAKMLGYPAGLGWRLRQWISRSSS